MAGSDRFEGAEATRSLGEEFLILAGGFKAFPCCRFMHTILECAERLSVEMASCSDTIFAIEIESIRDVADLLSTTRPAGFVDAQFSTPYAVALVLTGVPVGPGWFQYSRLHDPEILALAGKVRIRTSKLAQDAYQKDSRCVSAVVRIIMNSGRVLEATGEYPKGEVENPISEAEIITKYTKLASFQYTPPLVSEIFDIVMSIEDHDSIAELTRLLAAPCGNVAARDDY